MDVTKLVFVLFISLGAIVPTLFANIAEYDDVWRKREEIAWNNTLNAYEPNPEQVTSELNIHANRYVPFFFFFLSYL